MKVESVVFGVFVVFLTIVSIVYWFWSYDPTGTAALGICAAFSALISSYLYFTSRRMEPRAQDLPDAEVADGAGELGHFTPGSYFPICIAGSFALTALGLIFGLWLFLLGGVLLLGSVTGLLFENYVSRPVAAD